MYLKTEQLFREILDAADQYIEALELGRSNLDVDSPSDSQEFSAVGRVQCMLNQLAATMEAELRAQTANIVEDPPMEIRTKVSRMSSATRPDRFGVNDVVPASALGASPYESVAAVDLRTPFDARVDRWFENESAADDE